MATLHRRFVAVLTEQISGPAGPSNSHLITYSSFKMIMSVHGPLSRKRNILAENLSEEKRLRPEPDSEVFSEKVYSLFVKSAMESMEKVCIMRFPPPERLDSMIV